MSSPQHADQSHHLIGRDGVINRVLSTLEAGQRQVVWISGLGGIGKSAVARQCFDQAGTSLRVRIDEDNDAALTDGRLLVSSIAAQLRDRGHQLEHFSSALTQFEAVLERLAKDDPGAVSRLSRLLRVGTKVAANAATNGLAGDAADAIFEPLRTRASQSWAQVRAAHRFRVADDERMLIDNPLKLLTDAVVRDIQQNIHNRRARFALLWCDTYERTGDVLDEYLLRYFLPSAEAIGLRVRLLVSGRHPAAAHSREWIDVWGTRIEPIELEPLSESDVAEFIAVRCPNPLAGDIDAHHVYSRLGGIPLLLERWRLAGMPSVEAAAGGDESFFARAAQWLEESDRSALAALSVAPWLDRELASVMLQDPSGAVFDRLCQDSTLFERTPARGYRMREPLRSSAIGLLSERPTQFNEISSRYLEALGERCDRHRHALEDGGSTSSEERVALLLAMADAAPLLSDKAVSRRLVLPAVFASAYLAPEDLEGLNYQGQNELEAVRRAVVDALDSPSAAALDALLELASQLGDLAKFYCYLLVASSFRRLGMLPRSARVASTALSLRRTKHALLEAGLTKMHQGHFAAADKLFKECLAVDFGFAPAWACKGELQRQRAMWAEAAYELGMAVMSGDAPDYVFAERADALRELGRHDEAELSAMKAVSLNPTDYWNCAILGQVVRDQGRHEEAQLLYEEALSLCVDDYARACVKVLLGDSDDALKLLSEVIASGVQTRHWARYDPDWRRVASDPRFQEIVDAS